MNNSNKSAFRLPIEAEVMNRLSQMAYVPPVEGSGRVRQGSKSVDITKYRRKRRAKNRTARASRRRNR